MNGPTLQGLLGKGYARAAAHIGSPCNWYRGTLLNPIAVGNLLGNLPATFSLDTAFTSIPKFSSILFRAYVDTTQVQVGDFLVGASTYALIVSGMIPPTALICPQVVSVQRVTQTFTPSGGATQTTITIASGYPANVQLKRDKGFSMPAGFPAQTNTSAPMPEWDIALPIFTDGAIKEGDLITDENGYTYKADAVEFTPYGHMIAGSPYQPDA